MKFKYLKSLIPAALSLSLTFGMVSCVSDLDISPIDPQVSGTFSQDEVFTKLYAALVLTGQQGPSDKPDIASDDEGNTAFYRVMFTVNEYATDEMIWTWMDAGIPELIFMRWNSSHGTIEMLYNRLAYNITLCNFFLDQVEGQTDEVTVKQRAEARFLRALYYYYYMDLFGKAPFKEHFSEELPVEKNRADLFAYIESELNAIENDMYDPGKAPYGRADKAANWLLRARMNLNAEVYTVISHEQLFVIVTQIISGINGLTSIFSSFRPLCSTGINFSIQVHTSTQRDYFPASSGWYPYKILWWFFLPGCCYSYCRYAVMGN